MDKLFNLFSVKNFYFFLSEAFLNVRDTMVNKADVILLSLSFHSSPLNLFPQL